MPDRRALLGLFPGLDAVGGVQASGRLAWEGLATPRARSAGIGSAGAHLFCYGQPSSRVEQGSPGRATCAATRRGAVLRAVRGEWSAGLILVWHLSLLKLLPCFRQPRAGVAVFLHGVEAWRRQGWLTRRLLRRVDLFLANSEHTWSRFLQAHPECRGAPRRIVALGIGAPRAEPLPAPASPPIALMVSRLVSSEDYKGHREMLRAWPLAVERLPGAQLWIAGGGDLRGVLEQEVSRLGLGGSVRFTGPVSEEEKERLLAACRCLALPSRGEGFGLVYLEAMRLGRPCLVSTRDAGREVVEPPQAGLATDPDQAQAVADAVCRLLAPGDAWERWSRAARDRYERHFTARHFQARLVAALAPLATAP